jgi:hypothetical protein
MEQTTLPRTIQVSSATFSLLPEDVGLVLEPSGGVAMKVSEGNECVNVGLWK